MRACIDPIAGGNDNDYTYPGDPVNRTDLRWEAGSVENNFAQAMGCTRLGLRKCAIAVGISTYVKNHLSKNKNLDNAKRHFLVNIMLMAAIGKQATTVWMALPEVGDANHEDSSRDTINNDLVQHAYSEVARRMPKSKLLSSRRMYKYAMKAFAHAWNDGAYMFACLAETTLCLIHCGRPRRGG